MLMMCGVEGVERTRTIRLLVVMALALLGAACSSSTEQESASETAAPRDTGTESDTATAGPSQQERASAVRQAEQQLAGLRGQVEGLRQRAEIAGVESESASEQAIAEAQRTLASVEREVSSMKQATDAEWTAAKTSAEQALSGLGTNVDRVESEIRALSEAQRAERIEAIEPMLQQGLIEGLDGEPYLAYRPAFVEEVQEKLADLGLYDGPIDGFLEITTQRALAAFQEKNGLHPSGIPTPKTRAALAGGGSDEMQ
jgi:TolA-binding protein